MPILGLLILLLAQSPFVRQAYRYQQNEGITLQVKSFEKSLPINAVIISSNGWANLLVAGQLTSIADWDVRFYKVNEIPPSVSKFITEENQRYYWLNPDPWINKHLLGQGYQLGNCSSSNFTYNYYYPLDLYCPNDKVFCYWDDILLPYNNTFNYEVCEIVTIQN